ncbi:MAG: N-acetylmuramoyl-L-alanine amidase, partial [Armatimonadetes bacterium]|nr:N-acetylmuramoyl-L-alanine amidase [Armatimonadota bacterium]
MTPLARAQDQASLVRASARNEEVTLAFSSPVIYRAERFNNPARLIVNLYAVESGGAARDLPRLNAPWLKSVRTEPILGDSLRVILFLKDNVVVDVYGVPPADSIILTRSRESGSRSKFVREVRPKEGKPSPSSSSSSNPSNEVTFKEPAVKEPVRETPRPSSPSPAANPSAGEGGIQVTRIDFQHGDDLCRLQLDLSEPVRPQSFLLTTDPKKPRLVLDLPNARIIPTEQTVAVPDNPFVRQLRVGVFEHRGARVVFDLKRTVSYSVTSDKETGQVVLSLGTRSAVGEDVASNPNDRVVETPPTNNGDFGGFPPVLETQALKGRTIVIDAGHGGHDRGTSGHGQVEKHLALDISKRLHALLKNAGVNVVLTRDDDRFLRLPDRPAVANRMGADAFIAVHLNSTGSARNIWSGTETYYHFNDPICKELAQHIQAQLVHAIGLPERGARTDSRIAPRMGFSVLRNAQVPAGLVEVGFRNHPGAPAIAG